MTIRSLKEVLKDLSYRRILQSFVVNMMKLYSIDDAIASRFVPIQVNSNIGLTSCDATKIDHKLTDRIDSYSCIIKDEILELYCYTVKV